MAPKTKTSAAAPKAKAGAKPASPKKPATKKPAAASEPAPTPAPAASPAGHSLPRPDQALAPGAAAGVKMPAPEPVVGSVNVRYNHYNSAFEVVDSRLLFEVVDVEYCISFVFKGAWRAPPTAPCARASMA